MSQHLPIRIARPLHRQCVFQRTSTRPFSSSIALQKMKGRPDPAQLEVQAKNQPQKAPATVNAEILESGDNAIADDVGMLPGTFIRTWDATPPLLPSTFTKSAFKSTFGKRWRYEKTYLKTRISDLWQMLYYKWYIRRPSIKRRGKQIFYQPEVKKLAKEYYEKMNDAFAKKNETRISKICLTGLASHLHQRIAQRSPHTTMTWELLSFKPSLPIPIFDIYSNPRVVSNRMAQLPIPGAESRETPTAIRQVVLRISSKQRLGISHENPSSTVSGNKRKELTWTPDGEEIMAEKEELVQSDVHEKDVVEYLVLQRRMLRGEEEPWKVWGFADVTTLETIEKNEEQERQTLEYNATHPSMSGY